jgi:DNA polymerase V
VPRVEPYSIDEMFLDLDVPGDVVALARELREAVRR